MDGARHQLLAGARLARHQHGGVRDRHAGDHARARAAWRARRRRCGGGAASASRLRLEAQVLGAQRAVLAGAFDQHRQLVRVEGLDQVVVGPGLHGAHGRVDRGVGGHDHDRQVRVGGLQASLQVEPVHAGHLDVEEGDVVGAAGRQVQRLAGVLGHVDLVAVLPEPAAQGLAHDGLVVDHQQAQGGRAAGGLARRGHVRGGAHGSSPARQAAAWGGERKHGARALASESTSMWPRWRSTMP